MAESKSAKKAGWDFAEVSLLHSLKLVDEIGTKEELVASFSIVVAASIPRMVKPQLRS